MKRWTTTQVSVVETLIFLLDSPEGISSNAYMRVLGILAAMDKYDFTQEFTRKVDATDDRYYLSKDNAKELLSILETRVLEEKETAILKALKKVAPLSVIDHANDGQIVIYTGIKYKNSKDLYVISIV